MQKKSLAGSIALALLSILAGCGDDSPKPEETTGQIVFIGDSITASWPVQDYLSGAFNAGVAGEETPQMLDRFERDVLSRQPAAVVILGGINDINRRADSSPASIFAMVEIAMSAHVKVVVGTLPPATDPGIVHTDLVTELIGVLNDEIVDGAGEYGYDLVDYHAGMLLPDGSVNRSLFIDGVHPNKPGYRAMWVKLRPELAKLGMLRNP